MPAYADAAQLYDVLGDLFMRLKDDPVIGPAVAKSGLVIRFKYAHPDTEITIDASKFPVVLHLGPCEVAPVVDMSMEAETAHQFWLGKVNLVAALTRGTIKAKGPIPAIMKLLPVITPAYKIYPEILKQKGLSA